MAKPKAQKLFAGFLIAVGIILVCLYVVLVAGRGRPSAGMLIIGIVDLVVGFVLLGRARKSGEMS